MWASPFRLVKWNTFHLRPLEPLNEQRREFSQHCLDDIPIPFARVWAYPYGLDRLGDVPIQAEDWMPLAINWWKLPWVLYSTRDEIGGRPNNGANFVFMVKCEPLVHERREGVPVV